MNILLLPIEVLMHILTFLDIKSLVGWKELAGTSEIVSSASLHQTIHSIHIGVNDKSLEIYLQKIY